MSTPNPSDSQTARVLIASASDLSDHAARLARMALTPMPLTENATLTIGMVVTQLDATINRLRMLSLPPPKVAEEPASET